MVFSDQQIRHAVAQDHIVCVPFDTRLVRGSSLDVHLGEYFYRVNQGHAWDGLERQLFNPYNPADVMRYFGAPIQAPQVQDVGLLMGASLRNIHANDRVIVLEPGERILGHTDEFVGIKPPGTSEIVPRSTWARRGIMVECAGWGDPGFINRWTLEIWNLNPTPVVLKVGDRPAQMVFHETGSVSAAYTKGGGQYQKGEDIEEIVRNWHPSQMLPGANNDPPRASLRHKDWKF